MKRTTWKPSVGDIVKLSAYGYHTLALQSHEAFEQAERMRVNRVENVGTDSEPIWVVEVDQPLINRFILESTMLENITIRG